MGKIYLRLVIIEGKKYVVDQDGRQVENIIGIDSHCRADEIDEIVITLHETDQNGRMIMTGGHRA